MTYASNLKAIWMEIDYLWPTQNPQSVERQYILKQCLFTFLMGLNPTYESPQSQVLYHEKILQLEEAIGITRNEESRLKLVSEPFSNSSTAFITKKAELKPVTTDSWSNYEGPSQPQSQSNPLIQGSSSSSPAQGEKNKDALFCTYCKKRHHTKANFWKLAWKNQNSGKSVYVVAS